MTTMKKLLAVLTLGLLAFGARADVSRSASFGVTNTAAANVTTTANVGSAIDIGNWQNIALQCSFVGSATTNNNLVITFSRTIDDPDSSTAVWETTPKFTWTIPTDGTNSVVGFTNMPRDTISAVRGLKVLSIQNTATNTLSSLTLRLIGKERSK